MARATIPNISANVANAINSAHIAIIVGWFAIIH